VWREDVSNAIAVDYSFKRDQRRGLRAFLRLTSANTLTHSNDHNEFIAICEAAVSDESESLGLVSRQNEKIRNSAEGVVSRGRIDGLSLKGKPRIGRRYRKNNPKLTKRRRK
jgi:hypothetical protein